MSDASDAHRGFTARVLKSYSGIADMRLRSLVLDLIRHLHAFVGETELTDQECEFAWNFMGRMAAVPDRNEFLLAGDVLGGSQLIETLPHLDLELLGQFARAKIKEAVLAVTGGARTGTRSALTVRCIRKRSY